MGASCALMEREREQLAVTSSTRDRRAREPDPLDRQVERAGREGGAKRLLSLIGIGNHFRRDDAGGGSRWRAASVSAHPPGVGS